MATGNRLERLRRHLQGSPAGPLPQERVAVSASPARRPSYREVFAVSEFRALWLSFVLSGLGDRLALVALTISVYSRSKSPLLTAITFAAGFVPYLLGSLGLSGLADRRPRRTVMAGCDAARALLVGVMLVPGMPLGVLIALLYLVTTLQPPFDAARSASVRDIMEAGRYPLALAVLQSTSRVVVVAGSAAGGLVVALLGVRPALAGDALTFAASGLLVVFGVRFRPAAAAPGGQHALAAIGAGFRLVFGDPGLRTLIGLGWLAAFYELPEGLAAPYAGRLGGGAVAAGLLIATSQLGAVVATPFFTQRIGPLTRLRWMGPMAVLACGILLTALVRPGLAVSMAIFALSNVFAMYQIAANAAFVERLPNQSRAQAYGLANAGLLVGQGAAWALAGAAAEVVPPSAVIAAGGGVGALVACGLALRWRRMSPAVGRHTARHLGRQPSAGGQPHVPAARSR
jgi:hypothetical protein